MNTVFLLSAAGLFVLSAGFIAVPLWRLLPAADVGAPAAPPRRWAALCLIVGLGVSACLLYGVVGHPAALSQPADAVAKPAVGQGTLNQAQIESMVARLAQRLKSQPDDTQGWRMLIKSYETLGRFSDAAQAYRSLLQHEPPTADILTDFAVTLGMSQGGTLAGEPQALINRALLLNPNHVQALALSGGAAFEQGDYKTAAAQWRTLLSLIPADAELRDAIERNVERAQAKMH